VLAQPGERGSSILVSVPAGFGTGDGVSEGMTIRAGQPLMRLPA
jgi:hypothetical protein